MISNTGKPTSIIWISLLSESHSMMRTFTSVWVTSYAIGTGKSSHELRNCQNMSTSDHAIAPCWLSVLTYEKLHAPVRLPVSGFCSAMDDFTANLESSLNPLFDGSKSNASRFPKSTPSRTIFVKRFLGRLVSKRSNWCSIVEVHNTVSVKSKSWDTSTMVQVLKPL